MSKNIKNTDFLPGGLYKLKNNCSHENYGFPFKVKCIFKMHGHNFSYPEIIYNDVFFIDLSNNRLGKMKAHIFYKEYELYDKSYPLDAIEYWNIEKSGIFKPSIFRRIKGFFQTVIIKCKDIRRRKMGFIYPKKLAKCHKCGKYPLKVSILDSDKYLVKCKCGNRGLRGKDTILGAVNLWGCGKQFCDSLEVKNVN